MNESFSSSAGGVPQPGTVDESDPAASRVILPFQESIFLVGMMGAGKTTIGRALARKLGWQFVDLDHELEARCGVRVSLIFDIEGEQGFRKRETTLLDECTQRSGIVLATGGGAVLAPENRRCLSERGVVVYLRASADELFRRVERDRNRPLLQTDNPRQRLQELLAQREPLYHEVASVVFDTGSLPISQTTRMLLRQLQDYGTDKQRNTDKVKADITTVQVSTPGGDYPIHIGAGRLDHLHDVVPDDASAVALITSTTVGKLYGDRASVALERSGKRGVYVELPDGEDHKNWETLNRIFDMLLQHRLDRKAVLVALGGGVVGDMVGFAAATYMRGIRFIQVPTTLLAQVDSSVGGKTAINHPLGKNMIGAFHQPIAVEIDTDVLSTLPAREISAGLAEVIKYGMIIDAGFFAWCEQNMAALRALKPEAVMYALKRSCQLKAYVVSRDERESGLRAILNFGHTFGHAIEAGLGYGKWLHGEAVGCGMIQAADLSHRVLDLPRDSVQRIAALVQASGCPTTPPAFDRSRWLELMQVDKKAEGGTVRFVLLDKIGSAKVQPAPPEAVDAVLATAPAAQNAESARDDRS